MTAQTVENDKDKDTGAKTQERKTLFQQPSNPGLCLRHKALIFPCPGVKMCSVHCQVSMVDLKFSLDLPTNPTY